MSEAEVWVRHELTHYEFTDGTLTPGCTCGWWSPRREHSDFERHVRKMKQAMEDQ